jgi:hypothetical protein
MMILFVLLGNFDEFDDDRQYARVFMNLIDDVLN